jgi:sterol desaturase/sphingolipid hydroxylase (fatty acid hydroxylase superfamily)
MAFEEVKENVEDLKQQAKELLDANIRYYKLWGFKILMKTNAMVLKMILLGVLGTLVLLFFSLALALGIGYAVDNHALGFLIVGCIYLVCFFIVYSVRNKIVEGPLLARFSRIFLKKY